MKIDATQMNDRWTSASEIIRRVRTREQSAVEVVKDALRRIEMLNERYNSVTFLSPEEALQEAQQLDRKLASGESVGPLAGVPTLMKDLYGFRPGWPATLGGLKAAQNDRGPDGVWTQFPKQMRANEAILLGQTNSSTFGFSGATDNEVFGATKNPFDVSRNAGGSSGGSASAVGAGFVPAAGASDAGGSIRIPAAWSGTFGFQPSAGRVPSTPRPSLYHLGPHLYEGPVSRTVEDGLLFANALQEFNALDPYGVPADPLPAQLLTQGVRGFRIGLSVDLGGFPVAPEVRDTVVRAAEAFEGLGAAVESVDLDLGFSHAELTDMWLRSMGILMLADLESFAARGIELVGDLALPETVQYWTEEAKRMTLLDVQRDRLMRTAILDGMVGAQREYDLIIGPTVTDLPVPNADGEITHGPSRVDGVDINPLIGWCPTYLTNFTGAPSASVPAGLVDGLPVGLLIIGRKHRDADVFAASAAFEQARPWVQRYSLVQ